jgi:hypothetical protein
MQKHRRSQAFRHPPSDQAEEQARFVVMQHLKLRAIDHDTLLRMRDSRWSWISILDWINAPPTAEIATDVAVVHEKPEGEPVGMVVACLTEPG